MLRVGVGNHWIYLLGFGYRFCSSSLSLRALLGGCRKKQHLRVLHHIGSRTHMFRAPGVSTLLNITHLYRLTKAKDEATEQRSCRSRTRKREQEQEPTPTAPCWSPRCRTASSPPTSPRPGLPSRGKRNGRIDW